MRFAIVLLSVLFSGFSLAEATSHSLLGEVSGMEILAVPEFKAHYDSTESVQADEAFIEAMSGLELVLLFGSWCHDSQREVPRLLRVLEQGKFSVSYIAVSQDKEEPMVAVDKHQLKYTPTLVVYRQGKEIGRIVETPEKSWLEDLRALAVIQAAVAKH